MSNKKNILIVCDTNSLYSKLAEAYFRKYAGHWKNIYSAGINTNGESISPMLKAILEKDDLESTIDYTIKNIKEYDLNSFDYLMALTQKSLDHLKRLVPEDRIILVNIDNIKEQKTDVNEFIQAELLSFVKNGPIKRWLEMD